MCGLNVDAGANHREASLLNFVFMKNEACGIVGVGMVKEKVI